MIAEGLKTGLENDDLKYVLYHYFTVIEIHSRLGGRGGGGRFSSEFEVRLCCPVLKY